eukprot:Skav233652  [mRNA]  locus=scaffold2779:848490:848966:- [translate_table: standard]
MAQKEKKDAKAGYEKEPSERFKKTEIVLTIVLNGTPTQIRITKSDRIGTLRQFICREYNLEKGQKISFDTLNGGNFPLTKEGNTPSATTFLYSLGIENGDTIVVSLPTDGDDEVSDEANDNAIPLPSPQTDDANDVEVDENSETAEDDPSSSKSDKSE